jgi:hypothetical protein
LSERPLYVVSVDGTLQHRIPMPGDVDSAPVLLEDGLIAVGCDDGALHLVGDSNDAGVDAH